MAFPQRKDRDFVIKRTERVEDFNPQEYLKLVAEPVGVWIAEFLKRNKDFIEVCERIEQKRGAGDIKGAPLPLPLTRRFGVQVKNYDSAARKAGLRMEAVLPPPVHGVRILDPKDHKIVNQMKGLLNKAEAKGESGVGGMYETCDLSLHTFRLYPYSEEERYTKGEWDGRYETAMENILGPRQEDGTFNAKDKLLLAIDLRADHRAIDREIARYLRTYKLRREKRVRDDKWPYYLMVYDLRHLHSGSKKLAFKIILEIVNQYVPKNSGMNSENDAGRYYKRCVELINGGYRRYL